MSALNLTEFAAQRTIVMRMECDEHGSHGERARWWGGGWNRELQLSPLLPGASVPARDAWRGLAALSCMAEFAVGCTHTTRALRDDHNGEADGGS